MDASIIKTLAENPPPKRRFSFSAKECHARILELERVLCLPASPFTGYISRANARVAELERLIALRAAAPPVPALPPAGTPASAPSVQPLAMLRALSLHLFKEAPSAKLSEPEQRAEIERRLRHAHVIVPGVDSSRHIPPTGLRRAVAACLQASADAFLAAQKR